MRNQTRVLQYFREHRVASVAIAHVVVACVLGVTLLGGSFGSSLLGAFAQSPCSTGDQAYVVSSGDTLGAIAARYGTTWQKLQSYNKLSNANVLYIKQTICIPGKATTSTGSDNSPNTLAAKGVANFFPYGQCTWWASQRFYQMHGVFVPWRTNSNAWQWVQRAHDFGWRVSSTPSVGSIIVLQPWVQGAYGLGHVGVVERVLGNGRVITSHMNWGMNGQQVVHTEFRAGSGVSFITA